jgi:hypothetical protein
MLFRLLLVGLGATCIWLAIAARVPRERVFVMHPTAAPRAPIWPRAHTPCVDALGEEHCLTERYRASWNRLQAMEIGGMEEMLGEAFAGQASIAAAISPPGGVSPSIEACNKLSHDPVTVPVETLHRPQRDCFFSCLTKSDETACIRDHDCVHLPALDGEWRLVTVVPRLGCPAQLADVKTPARCATLAAEVDEPNGSTTTCSPRKLCEGGASGVPGQVAPYVLYGGTDCATRPANWWCTPTRQTFPRAECMWGRW